MSDPTQMQLEVTRPLPRTSVINVCGELDMLTAPDLGDQINGQLAADDLANLLIDLTELSFLSSSGLATLVLASQQATQRGVRLLLVANSRSVLRPMEITGTASTFDIHATQQDALAACG